MTKTLSMSESIHQERIQRAATQKGYLKRLKHQTEAVCIAAVQLDGLALKDVHEQTERICLEAVKRNGLALEFVEKQTEIICCIAVRKNPEMIKYVKEPTEQICLETIEGFRHCRFDILAMRKMLPLDTPKIQKAFVEAYPSLVLKEPHLSEEIWLIAIKQKPYFLKHCVNQTEAICLEAVKQAGLTLKNVKHQTLAIVEAALNQNGLALHHVKGFESERNRLEEMAVKKNPLAIEFVRTQTEKLCWLALNGSILAFKYIKDPTEEMKWFVSDLSFKFRLKEPEFQWVALTYLSVNSLDQMFEKELNPHFKEKLSQFKEQLKFFRSMMESLYYFLNGTNEVVDRQTGIRLTIEEAIANYAHSLLLLNKYERTYRRCRYAVYLNDNAKMCSPYHALECVEEN